MFFKGDKRIAWLCLWCIIRLNSNMEREHLFTHMPKFACHICLQQSNNQILHFVNPRLNSKLHRELILWSWSPAFNQPGFQKKRVFQERKHVTVSDMMIQHPYWKVSLVSSIVTFCCFHVFRWEASLKLSIYCGYCILQIFRSQESLWASDC